MNLDRNWMPARRAGQPDMAEGPVMPQGDVQERAGLIAELQEARAEAAKWKSAYDHLAPLTAASTGQGFRVGDRVYHPGSNMRGVILKITPDNIRAEVAWLRGGVRRYITIVTLTSLQWYDGDVDE